ncbi:uncharacterized protein LOC134248519 [Saccostrea cucullata]|uniref:uncharacterized protein LOC134248519 n=1 Tax=Saccostrea cuccullata TaxID=36930 RepID=UPI002ED01402
MKRIDFVHGVLCLSIIILSPFVFNIYGYLDEVTCNHVTHENSFYGETTVPVCAYRIYRFYLIYVYAILFHIVVALVSDANDIYKRVSRLQIGCYRPHLIYHTMVCLIPAVVRYVNMNGEIQDDVMLQMEWEKLYKIISSVVRFIFGFVISVVRKYKIWRSFLYLLITIVHALMFFHFLCMFFSSCKDLLDFIKENNGNFFSTWSYNDHTELPINDLKISKINKIHSFLYLDQDLFLNTGEMVYQSRNQQQYQYKDERGLTLPYYRNVPFISTGESVRLSCAAATNAADQHDQIRVFWTLEGRNVASIRSQNKITTDVKSIRTNWISVESTLNIDAIKNSEFGDYSCSFHMVESSSGTVYFQNKKASEFILVVEYLIGQYSVRKYKGQIFFLYLSPGSVVELQWRPMSFNTESNDLAQYYYINGVPHSGENSTCSPFSYLYFLYGKAMNWFFIPDFPSPSHYFLYGHGSYETKFIQCAGPWFFGVHRVEYIRRIYDEKSRSYIFMKVNHPDTLIVLPDLPYFLKMDNTTKADKEKIIRKIQEFNMEYIWFENSHTGILAVRLVTEVLILLFIIIFLGYVSYKMFHLYKRFVIKPIRKISLGSPILDKSDSDYVEYTCTKEYSCYVVSGDSDKEVVYNTLVLPLREKNITTGFIFEECSINKSGKSEFDIQSDIIKKCENLIFFVTSSYLKEEPFLDIHLNTVLKCIQMENISPNSVLVRVNYPINYNITYRRQLYTIS